SGGVERADRGGAKRGDIVLHEIVRVAEQVAMLAADGAPDERAVAGVEFLDAMRRFDHLRPRHAKASFLAHDHDVAALRHDPHAAEAAVRSADEGDDHDTGRARGEQRVHDLGHGDETRVRLVQPHAARFEQQQNRIRLLGDGALEQPRELGAVYFADRAAHELAFLRSREHPASIERARADHHAVVEGDRQIERRQMRAGHARLRRQQFDEGIGIENAEEALARARFVIALLHDAGRVNSSTAWSRRRLTTAGVAPTSLTEMRTSLSWWRSKKSRSTASQILPKPSAAVLISMRQAPFNLAGSISTSRLPEEATPTSAGAAFGARTRPP